MRLICHGNSLLLFMPLRYFPAYLQQRFPPLAMLLFVILYLTVSTVALERNPSPWQGFLFHGMGILACISFFFRLRVMDEIKDKHIDQAVHPERLVVQGKIRIAELMYVAIPGLLLEAFWSWYISTPSFIAWLAALGYSILMRYEFFVPKFLERNFLLYAFSHTLIMPFVVVWLWFANSDRFTPELGALAGVAFFAALAYEVARKTFATTSEPELIQTYSKLLGKDIASRLSFLLLLINTLFLGVLFHHFHINPLWILPSLILFLVVVFVYTRAINTNEDKSFRLAEKLVSLAMLINYLLLIILLWMR